MQVPSQTPRFVVILYLFLFAILAAQISDAHKVHSRFGLAFTGIVQLCCSAVMSISVLVLLGWNGWGSSSQESTLPAYILPFVIVVVGVENMSTLVCSRSLMGHFSLIIHEDESRIFHPLHPLCPCTDRSRTQQGRHYHRADLIDRSRSPWPYLALRQPPSGSRILLIRRCRNHYRLVYAAYLLSYRKSLYGLKNGDR